MKKRSVGVVLCIALLLISGTVFGEDSMPSSKSAIAMGDLALATKAAQEAASWQTVLRTYIKTSEQKDLIFDVALQCALFTRTLAKSKGGDRDTASAMAGVAVRVVMDPQSVAPRYALPGGEEGVIYSKRYQELSAVFQGILQVPIDTDGDGIPDDFGDATCLSLVDTNDDGIPDKITLDEECLTPEEVELILSTLAAHSFNFCLEDVGSGVHEVVVEAMIIEEATAQAGEAEAVATLGLGSMVVDEVRMIK